MRESEYFSQDRIGALITLHAMNKPGHFGMAVHKHGHDFTPGEMPTERCPDSECIMALVILTPAHVRWIDEMVNTASEHPMTEVVRD